MADWVKKLDAFLAFNERNILQHAGKISAAMAEEHAQREFEKFDQARLERGAAEPTSDFDKIVDAAKRLEQTPSGQEKSKPRPRKGGKRAKD